MRETVLNLKQLLRDVTGFVGACVGGVRKSEKKSLHVSDSFPTGCRLHQPRMQRAPSSNHHLLSLTYATLWKFGKIQYCDNFFVHFKSGFELRRGILVKIEIEFRLMASLWMVLHQQAISLKANIERGSAIASVRWPFVPHLFVWRKSFSVYLHF